MAHHRQPGYIYKSGRHRSRRFLFYLFEMLVLAVSPFAALTVRENFAPGWTGLENVVPYAFVGIVVAAVIFSVSGIYRGILRHTSPSDLVHLVTVITASIAITVVIMSLATGLRGMPRSLPLIQWGLLVLGMGTSRMLLRVILRRWDTRHDTAPRPDREHVLVVGAGPVAELYLRCMSTLAPHRISVEGILDEKPVLKGRWIHHHRILGQPAELRSILAALNVHGVLITRIVVAMPFRELLPESRDILLHWEQAGGITLEMFEEKLGFQPPEIPGEHPGTPAETISFLHGEQGYGQTGQSMDYGPLKRIIDVLGAAVLLVTLLPVIMVTGLLVAIDVGLPLLFWQLRPGNRGRPFRVYKFRTMGAGHDSFGNRIPDEDRLGKIGWILRRTRMDELPQLYHILVGEMSFVGPRPLLPVDLPAGRPDLVAIRNSIRPGLTGWAQVNGGKDVSIEDKAVLDIWYRENMSLALDIRILMKTAVMVVTGEKLDRLAIHNAYRDLGLQEGLPPPMPKDNDSKTGESIRPAA